MSRLHREPLQRLIALIVEGTYRPADKLPREEVLAERYFVSRGIVRECLRALEDRGLVAVRHGVGAFVAAREQWAVVQPDVLAALLRTPAAARLLPEILDFQRVLEVEAARHAAVGHVCGRDGALERELAALGRATSEADVVAAVAGLRTAIMRAEGRSLVRGVHVALQRALDMAGAASPRPADPASAVEPMRTVVRAIRTGDARAAAASMNRYFDGIAVAGSPRGP
jgi:GntR family transcriptional repressor for pyruvate dehydrogenase complex